MKELATDLKKDGSHQNQNATKHIVRFPRLIRRFPRLPRRFPRLRVFFKLGDLVHHTEFGTGTINSIWGCNLTVAFCDEERELDFGQVVTRALAEERWQECYSHGANRRLEEGRWLWVVRSLCHCSHRGEWTAFLEKSGVPRSTAFDLIARYLQERSWETQHSSGNRTEGRSTSGNRTNPDAEGADNAEILNAEREKVVGDEMRKREGKSAYKYWNIRIKLREAVAEDCQEKYAEDGDDAKAHWTRAAYEFVGREEELEFGSDEPAEEDGSPDE